MAIAPHLKLYPRTDPCFSFQEWTQRRPGVVRCQRHAETNHSSATCMRDAQGPKLDRNRCFSSSFTLRDFKPNHLTKETTDTLMTSFATCILKHPDETVWQTNLIMSFSKRTFRLLRRLKAPHQPMRPHGNARIHSQKQIGCVQFSFSIVCFQSCRSCMYCSMLWILPCCSCKCLTRALMASPPTPKSPWSVQRQGLPVDKALNNNNHVLDISNINLVQHGAIYRFAVGRWFSSEGANSWKTQCNTILQPDLPIRCMSAMLVSPACWLHSWLG